MRVSMWDIIQKNIEKERKQACKDKSKHISKQECKQIDIFCIAESATCLYFKGL